MSELIAAFIAIHGLYTFLSDVFGFLDYPGKTVWLSANHCRLELVDLVILLVFVVGLSGFVYRWPTGNALTSCDDAIVGLFC